MSNSIFRTMLCGIFAIVCAPAFVEAQSFFPSGGAQCGEHASGGCEHYISPCPDSTDALVEVLITTDGSGAETSWLLRDLTDSAVVAQA